MPVLKRRIRLVLVIGICIRRLVRPIPDIHLPVEILNTLRGSDGEHLRIAVIHAVQRVGHGELVRPCGRFVRVVERVCVESRAALRQLGLLVAVGFRSVHGRVGDFLTLVDFRIDLDGLVLHRYMLDVAGILDAELDTGGLVVVVRGHRLDERVFSGFE